MTDFNAIDFSLKLLIILGAFFTLGMAVVVKRSKQK